MVFLWKLKFHSIPIFLLFVCVKNFNFVEYYHLPSEPPSPPPPNNHRSQNFFVQNILCCVIFRLIFSFFLLFSPFIPNRSDIVATVWEALNLKEKKNLKINEMKKIYIYLTIIFLLFFIINNTINKLEMYFRILFISFVFFILHFFTQNKKLLFIKRNHINDKKWSGIQFRVKKTVLGINFIF